MDKERRLERDEKNLGIRVMDCIDVLRSRA